MIRQLLRLRYWRLRALRAERELVEVKADALAEAHRNRNREDYFVSAAVMGGRGMVGIPPRSGHANAQPPPRIATVVNPWDALTWFEKAEFETEWLVPGMAEGRSRQQIESDFLRELGKRKQFNDEPSM